MVDILPETSNRIRLSDNELILLHRILKKINEHNLSPEEKKFLKLLMGKVEGRLKLKKENSNF